MYPVLLLMELCFCSAHCVPTNQNPFPPSSALAPGVCWLQVYCVLKNFEDSFYFCVKYHETEI